MRDREQGRLQSFHLNYLSAGLMVLASALWLMTWRRSHNPLFGAMAIMFFALGAMWFVIGIRARRTSGH